MSACNAQPGRVPLLAVTVPQPLAWAVGVRNASVINVHVPPPDSAFGGYVAVCAGVGYEEGIREWAAKYCGVDAPTAVEVPTSAVVAVGRLAAVTEHPDAPRESPWFVGPMGLWLADVVALPEAVPCSPPLTGIYWELPPDVLAQVRAAYASVQQAGAARWRAYNERAAAALRAQQEPPPGLRERVLRLCGCRRAMTPCPTCRTWRCTAPGCPSHVCPTETRQP